MILDYPYLEVYLPNEVKDITKNYIKRNRFAIIREFVGAGTFYGIEIMPLTTNGGWYMANNFFLTPASSFFIIGFTIWALRQWKTDQIEEPEFKISKNSLEAEKRTV